ncbi:unnamed protein product [Protopolystoma xenopodis]|uniref:Trematode PH-like domain-containing protein n=1 Tax=Protopolystoma xenopodis TaxID=117903 RepID=A0A3S4ZZ78_9PLAT|nr:unnamed protein product [Protopolystoma xenopodis]
MPTSTKVKRTQLQAKQHKFFEASCDIMGRTRLQDGETFNFDSAQQVLSSHINHKATSHCKLRCMTDHLYMKRSSPFGMSPPRSYYAYTDIKRFFVFNMQPYTVVMGVAETTTLGNNQPTSRHGARDSRSLPSGVGLFYTLVKFKNSTLANEFCDLLLKAQAHPHFLLTLEDYPNAMTYSSQSSLVGHEPGHELGHSTARLDGMQTNGRPEMQESRSETTAALMAAQFQELDRPHDAAAGSTDTSETPSHTTAHSKTNRRRKQANADVPEQEEEDDEDEDEAEEEEEEEEEKEEEEVKVTAQVRQAQPAYRRRSPSPIPPGHESPVLQATVQSVTAAKPSQDSGSPAKRAEFATGLRKHRSYSNHPSSETRNGTRDPPRTESMLYRSKSSNFMRPFIIDPERLHEELTKNTKEDDMWAVDLKYITTHPVRGCEISPRGSVYMFTAHHMVPEYRGFSVCSSSSGSANSLK